LLCRARQQGETVKGKTAIATGSSSGLGQRHGPATWASDMGQRHGIGACHTARGARGNIMLNGFGNSANLKEAPRKLASCAIGVRSGAPKAYLCADAAAEGYGAALAVDGGSTAQ